MCPHSSYLQRFWFFSPFSSPVKCRAYRANIEAALIFAFGLIFLLMSRYSLHIGSAYLPFTQPADGTFHRSCCFNEFKCVAWEQRQSWWSLYTSACKSCMNTLQVSSSLPLLVFCWPSHLRPLPLFSRLSSIQISNVKSVTNCLCACVEQCGCKWLIWAWVWLAPHQSGTYPQANRGSDKDNGCRVTSALVENFTFQQWNQSTVQSKYWG